MSFRLTARAAFCSAIEISHTRSLRTEKSTGILSLSSQKAFASYVSSPFRSTRQKEREGGQLKSNRSSNLRYNSTPKHTMDVSVEAGHDLLSFINSSPTRKKRAYFQKQRSIADGSQHFTPSILSSRDLSRQALNPLRRELHGASIVSLEEDTT